MHRPEHHVEYIARFCHEIIRAYCASVGDNSQVEWRDASECQRKSVMNDVRSMLANIDAPPSGNDMAEQPQRSKDFLFRATVRLLA